ncbi:ficolin-2-like [Physella acuta]|uniref:ficolin-2-like n=1 Tax=Physella acuta TaxID=109671 RepID=UPI0027DC957B|nr:ficolin-2-like [Physella acuta]
MGGEMGSSNTLGGDSEGGGDSDGGGDMGRGMSIALSVGYNELRFDMKYKGKDYYAVYRGFKVENEAAKYKMSITSFGGGNAGDWFRRHNGLKFTTIDSDNDRSHGNCAEMCEGGWWYERCQWVNVNGKFKTGMQWHNVASYKNSLSSVEMKLRRT